MGQEMDFVRGHATSATTIPDVVEALSFATLMLDEAMVILELMPSTTEVRG